MVPSVGSACGGDWAFRRAALAMSRELAAILVGPFSRPIKLRHKRYKRHKSYPLDPLVAFVALVATLLGVKTHTVLGLPPVASSSGLAIPLLKRNVKARSISLLLWRLNRSRRPVSLIGPSFSAETI